MEIKLYILTLFSCHPRHKSVLVRNIYNYRYTPHVVCMCIYIYRYIHIDIDIDIDIIDIDRNIYNSPSLHASLQEGVLSQEITYHVHRATSIHHATPCEVLKNSSFKC